MTNEERKLEFIGSTYCLKYNTKVSFYIEPPRSPGSKRNLVSQYENGRAELVYAIADNQSKEEILRNALLQYPLNTSELEPPPYTARGATSIKWLRCNRGLR